MNYALNSTEVFGTRIRSGERGSSSREASALAALTRTPAVWGSIRRSKRCSINWNRALGLGTMAIVSAAGWGGIALAVAWLLK